MGLSPFVMRKLGRHQIYHLSTLMSAKTYSVNNAQPTKDPAQIEMQHITGTNHTAKPFWMQHKVWEWKHISLLITSTFASHSTIIVTPIQGAGMRTPALINNFTIWTVTHHKHPGCNIRCRDQHLSVFTICTITQHSHLCRVLPLSWWVWLCTRLTCLPRGPTKLSGATFALQIVSLEE